MNLREFFQNLDIVLLCLAGVIVLVKSIVFAKAANDRTPYNFFYNDRTVIHASNFKSVKKSKKLQNRLTVLFVCVIAFLLLTSVFKYGLL